MKMRQTDQDTEQPQMRVRDAARRGQATVEFALVMVVMFAVLYGIIEISRLLLVSAQLDNAAREGAHYAALHPGVDKGCIKSVAIAPKLTMIDTSRVEVGKFLNAQSSGGGSSIQPFSPVTVTVNYTWTSLVNIMPDMNTLTLKPLGPLVLHASAVGVIENADNASECPQANP